MQIEYDRKNNWFLIKCGFEHNSIVTKMPDRRFRKGSRTWVAPALRRNVRYMAQHMNNPQMYSEEALAVFNKKRAELDQKPKGEAQFPAWFEFKNAPMKHQNIALSKFYPLNEAAILFEQGLGKTYTAINLAAAWRMTGAIDAAVVVCPSSIKLVWEDELDEHCPVPTQRHVLTAGRYKAADRFIENKDDFQWLIVGIEGLSQGKAHEYVERFLLSHRCAMIVDESSRIKTPNAVRTDRCISLGRLAHKRVILSGTSVTQGVEDWYTQFQFLNPDIIGYSSYYSFRAQYCETITIETGFDPRTGRVQTVQKIVGYKNEDELVASVAPYTLRVEKKDVLEDMPDKVFMNRYVEMNPTQRRLYKDMEHEFFAEVEGDEYEVTSVLEQALRLQQITGGHYPWDDGERVVAKPIPGKNPKLEELMAVLDETSGKAIVWCQFRPEIDLIADRLRKEGIQFVEFHGGCDDTEKGFAVRNFRSDPKTKVFLATRAAAYGLTLVEAATAIYYSQGPSLEDYSQSQDRIHRIGQDMPCTYIHLVCDKTIDMKIIRALRDKKNVADLIYSLVKEAAA